MKKLILAFIILVVSVIGGYSLYKFTDVFSKNEKINENTEIEIVETAEK